MCEFISWIETSGEVLFLTGDDLKDKYGKEVLEGSRDNDFIGHGAIRAFYNLQGGVEKENRNFWDGLLPQEIKDAWNSGKLDNMLRHLQTDDLEHIVQNAPENFAIWAFAQKYGHDFEAMKKDSNSYTRLTGYAATIDFGNLVRPKL